MASTSPPQSLLTAAFQNRTVAGGTQQPLPTRRSRLVSPPPPHSTASRRPPRPESSATTAPIDIPGCRKWYHDVEFTEAGIPKNWKHAPARVHHWRDNITHYHRSGSNGWETLHSEYLRAAQKEVGQIKQGSLPRKGPRIVLRRKDVDIVPMARDDEDEDADDSERARRWRKFVANKYKNRHLDPYKGVAVEQACETGSSLAISSPSSSPLSNSHEESRGNGLHARWARNEEGDGRLYCDDTDTDSEKSSCNSTAEEDDVGSDTDVCVLDDSDDSAYFYIARKYEEIALKGTTTMKKKSEQNRCLAVR